MVRRRTGTRYLYYPPRTTVCCLLPNRVDPDRTGAQRERVLRVRTRLPNIRGRHLIFIDLFAVAVAVTIALARPRTSSLIWRA